MALANTLAQPGAEVSRPCLIAKLAKGAGRGKPHRWGVVPEFRRCLMGSVAYRQGLPHACWSYNLPT
jgi:hypothetical protein